MKSLRELIKEITANPMSEQALMDAERRLYRFFQLLYEIKQSIGEQYANK